MKTRYTVNVEYFFSLPPKCTLEDFNNISFDGDWGEGKEGYIAFVLNQIWNIGRKILSRTD